MEEVHIDLYREHLEEASFLYDQRLHLLTDPELPWTALHDFEQRLEAHIDALVVGGELALRICRERADEGDAGELFAAVCVYCRQAQPRLLSEVLQHPEAHAPERARALAEALKHELPEAWQAQAVRALEQGRAELVPVWAEVIGHRRIADGGALERRLLAPPEGGAAPLLQALSRCAAPAAAPASAIRQSVGGDAWADGDALRALLVLRDPATLDACQHRSDWPDGLAPWVAMASGRAATGQLLQRLNEPEPAPDVLQALGLLGDLSTVRPLLQMLGRPELAPAAAEALHVITGAGLYEEVLVPNEVEDDERLDGEAEPRRAQPGTGAFPAAEEAAGSRVRRLSHDPAAWEAWLAAHASRFAAHRRFRLGQLYGPAVLLQCLAAIDYPKPYRRFVADELRIAHAIDLRFETDMRVAEQQRELRGAAPALTAAHGRYEPGRWYVNGTLCEPG